MNPICPIHKIKIYLIEGDWRITGGFVNNHWYCGEVGCKYTIPARNKEEEQRQSYQQLHPEETFKKYETVIRTSKTI